MDDASPANNWKALKMEAERLKDAQTDDIARLCQLLTAP